MTNPTKPDPAYVLATPPLFDVIYAYSGDQMDEYLAAYVELRTNPLLDKIALYKKSVQEGAVEKALPFERMCEGLYAQVKCEEAISEILGVDLLGIGFDCYDSSFEIYPDEDVVDIEPTQEQNEKILALGCARYWINFKDETQRYGCGPRTQSTHNRWDAYNNNKEAKRHVEAELAELRAALAEAKKPGMRRLSESDAFCPSCGHNRDESSISTIDLGDSIKQCQLCRTKWSELPVSEPAEQQGEQEPNWKHPKIQALLSRDARKSIELGLIEQLLENPEFETTALDMEYWDSTHDKLKEVLTQYTHPDRVKAEPLTEERMERMVDAYTKYQIPVDRGYAQQEEGMRLALIAGGFISAGTEIVEPAHGIGVQQEGE